jgi:uncharacterized protein (DUF1015 family)
MADVRPFVAVRYAERLGPVVAPPYDVLSDEDVRRYEGASPHNVVRLTRPGHDYDGAARVFGTWLDTGVLAEDDMPAMYVHETSFAGRVRRDLVATLRLQPYEDRVVLPHERTHRGPKEDRLALLRATGVSLEPLWFLADGLDGLLGTAPEPDSCEEFSFGPERHSLARVTDATWIEAVTNFLAERPLLIADGHHRYETTLAYSRELGGGDDAASRFTLALITDLSDPGLVVLPTHRLLKSGVAVTGGEVTGSLEETLTGIRGRVAAGSYRDGRFQILPLEGNVPALELHRQVIDNILGQRDPEGYLTYTRDAAEAVRWVDEGKGVAAFFLDTPDLAAVLQAARAGITMPQKTTYFFPKPPSGMAFHRLDPHRRL